MTAHPLTGVVAKRRYPSRTELDPSTRRAEQDEARRREVVDGCETQRERTRGMSPMQIEQEHYRRGQRRRNGPRQRETWDTMRYNRGPARA
ncbi:MAG: hypothetical protein OXG44_05100 [Gammaproteobacteria bacterium]|nr:hypothetical protein [Gammaproteobacteria bacterium]